MGKCLNGTSAILGMDCLKQNNGFMPGTATTNTTLRTAQLWQTFTKPTTHYNTSTSSRSKHPTIKFEQELHDHEGYLSILDIPIKLATTMTLSAKHWCLKRASKNITQHYQSHHPSTGQRAAINNQLQRVTQCSSTKHRQETISSTWTKLLRNGYPHSWMQQKWRTTGVQIKSTYHSYLTPSTSTPDTSSTNITYQCGLPTDEVPLSNSLPQRGKKRHDKTCKSKLCAAPTICPKSKVVYEATCTPC